MRLIHNNIYDVKLSTKTYKLFKTYINVKLQNNIFLEEKCSNMGF